MELRNPQGESLDTLIEGASLHDALDIVILVHGFGTDLHERGLFDELSAELTSNFSNMTVVRFSWSGFGKSEGEQEEATFQKVSTDFETVLDWVFVNKPALAKVSVIGFSMGNIITSNVLASGKYMIRKIINANPADFMPGNKSFQKWLSYRGARIENDILIIPRSDGTITRIHRRFWDTMDEIHYQENLEKTVSMFPSTLVRATNDQIVDNSELKAINFSEIIELTGNHNYSDSKDRKKFLNAIADLLIEKNTIVDENDNVIGAKVRSEITPTDIYRVAALWLRNNKGQVLLARRALTKSHDPGKWGPAVAGTVAEGDDYLATIERETEEEIGLSDLDFQEGPKKLQHTDWTYFSQRYFATTDKDILDMKIQKDEVEEVKWFDEATLHGLIKEKPEMFIQSMCDY